MTIDPRSHTPVYVQLADLLREEIESGRLEPGSSVGSEARLSQEHGIGREAVRMAMAVLRSEGLVSTIKGQGSRVREQPERKQVELPPGAVAIARMPTSTERRDLDLDEGVPVFEIRNGAGDIQALPADQVQLIRPKID